MLRTGTCPKCGSTEVYCDDNLPWKTWGGYGNGLYISAWGWNYAVLDNYVCASCGYSERYVQDRSKLFKIARNWRRVGPVLSAPQQQGFIPLGAGAPAKTCPNCQSALPKDWKACPYCGQPMT